VGKTIILFVLGDKMGEIFCTIIGLLFIFGSISIFASLIAEKHYERPVKHSAIDNDLADVIIADDLFDEEN
jgi:energy-converting hydrogenase Eha subunit F